MSNHPSLHRCFPFSLNQPLAAAQVSKSSNNSTIPSNQLPAPAFLSSQIRNPQSHHPSLKLLVSVSIGSMIAITSDPINRNITTISVGSRAASSRADFLSTSSVMSCASV